MKYCLQRRYYTITLIPCPLLDPILPLLRTSYFRWRLQSYPSGTPRAFPKWKITWGKARGVLDAKLLWRWRWAFREIHIHNKTHWERLCIFFSSHSQGKSSQWNDHLSLQKYLKFVFYRRDVNFSEKWSSHRFLSNRIRLIHWLIDWCLTSSEQFFSYIQDENI